MNTADFNRDIEDWASGTSQELDRQFDTLNIQHVKRSPSKVSSRETLQHLLSYRNKMAYKISFKFPRHMVFVEKGLGKDTPRALQGMTNRIPKSWFNDPMDERVDILADKVQENYANMAVKSLKIK